MKIPNYVTTIAKKPWVQKAKTVAIALTSVENIQIFLTKKISSYLPKFKNIKPIEIYYSLLVLGLFTALIYFFATYISLLYLFGIVLIILRLSLEILAKLLAPTAKSIPEELQVLGRITSIIADTLLLIGIIAADSDYTIIGILALSVLLILTSLDFILFESNTPRLASFIKLHRDTSLLTAGRFMLKRQTILLDSDHRLMVLLIVSFFQFFTQEFRLKIDCIYLFLIWITLYGIWIISSSIYAIIKNKNLA